MLQAGAIVQPEGSSEGHLDIAATGIEAGSTLCGLNRNEEVPDLLQAALDALLVQLGEGHTSEDNSDVATMQKYMRLCLFSLCR